MLYFDNHLTNDPALNLAIEETLLEDFKQDLLMLWSNSDSVIIGRNQSAKKEVDLNYLTENQIKLVRRKSGGGAVYQDLGNLNYTFFTKNKNNNYLDLLIKSLNEMGIKAFFSGRNDILLKDKKISGTASFTRNDNLVLHGTLLYDVNLNHLTNVLTPDKEKLDRHHIRSVKSRVGNIKDLLKDNKNINRFRKELLDIIIKRTGASEFKEKNLDKLKVDKFFNCSYNNNCWNFQK